MKKKLLWNKENGTTYRRLLLLLCVCFVAFPSTMRAQVQQRISLEMNQATIEQVVKRLQETTRYKFSFREEDLKQSSLRNYSFLNATISKVMDDLVAYTSLEWSETQGTIVISLKKGARSTQSSSASSVQRSVSGKVKNEAGDPLAGASVFLKSNPSVGTPTDAAGNFTLRLPSSPGNAGPHILVYKFLGMLTQEIPVDNRERFDVTLKDAFLDIGAVVVRTGYQDIPKDRMTGAVETITAKDIENNAFMSIDAILSGKISGLYSSLTSGAPGAASEIRIRGDNSISGNLEPLWVLDGLPLQSGVMSITGITAGNVQQSILDHGIGSLAPSDIESVTVLKDAAATAIYGAKAANGVIVIKTKSGSEGPLTINYQGNFALTTAPNMSAFNFMNAEQKIQHEIELSEEFGSTDRLGNAGRLWQEWQKGTVSTEEYNRQLDEWRKVDVNWFDEIYRMNFSQNHNLSVRGGTNKFWFYGSLNAVREKGALITNDFTHMNTSVNIGFRPHEKLTVDFRVNGSYRESNDHASAIDPFKYAIFANPYEKPYNDDGTYATDNSFIGSNDSNLHEGYKYNGFNILREMKETHKNDIASDIGGTLSLKLQITPDLKAEVLGRAGYSTNNGETAAGVGTYSSYVNYFSLRPFYPLFGTIRELPDEYNRGYIRVNSGRSKSFSYRAALSYNKDIAEKHHVTVFLGNEVSSIEGWNNTFRTAQYDMQYYFAGFPEFAWEPKLTTLMGGDLKNMSKYVYGGLDRTVSFFGAATYSYMDRYVVNFNTRFDGASTIDPNNRFAPFWSISGRWNLHNEKIIQDNLPFIYHLAVRAVYGYTGNIDRSALPYPYILLDASRYDGEYVAGKLNYPNPSIKWEKKQERSIGVDYSFFDNRIGGSFNYYNNQTNDVLGVTSAPNSALNTNPRMNVHSVNNRGIEFLINVRYNIGEFRFGSQFNVARNKNVITKSTFPSVRDFVGTGPGNHWAGYSGPIEGYSTTATFGYRFAGVDPITGEALIYLSEDARMKYAKDKGIDLADAPYVWDTQNSNIGITESRETWMKRSLVLIGRMNPKYTGGFSTSVGWKNLEVRANFNYAVGHLVRTFDERNHTYNDGFSTTPKYSELYASRVNRLATAANRWRAPGDITNIPRYSAESTVYYYMFTDNKFTKGDYLNFSNLSVSYNIKGSLLDSWGIANCRLGFQVQNVYVWSRLQSTDPSTSSAFGYPRTRKFLINLQISL